MQQKKHAEKSCGRLGSQRSRLELCRTDLVAITLLCLHCITNGRQNAAPVELPVTKSAAVQCKWAHDTNMGLYLQSLRFSKNAAPIKGQVIQLLGGNAKEKDDKVLFEKEEVRIVDCVEVFVSLGFHVVTHDWFLMFVRQL